MRKHHDTATVNIHVRDLAQMFNSLDPSPFWDRDLDQQAAGFIEGEFSDRLRTDRWLLHVHAHEGTATAADLQAALERYYERLVASTRLSLREQTRVGEIALIAGVAVFSLCISLESALRALPRALDEGLIVLAWIALWRPIEMLAYGWVPLYRRRRLYDRLRRMRVSVSMEPSSAHERHAQSQEPQAGAQVPVHSQSASITGQALP
jgi:hypothetical protein